MKRGEKGREEGYGEEEGGQEKRGHGQRERDRVSEWVSECLGQHPPVENPRVGGGRDSDQQVPAWGLSS